MRYTIGNGGWVRFEVDDPSGLLLYVRMSANANGRFVIRELYLDGSELPDDVPLDTPEIRALPIDKIEAVLNFEDARDWLERSTRMLYKGIPLAVLASNFNRHYGSQSRPESDWVAGAYFAQVPGHPLSRPIKKRPLRKDGRAVTPASNYRLKQGPGGDGLTDAFLSRVARAYQSAVTRGEQPNRAIADDVGVPLKTVQRWVYTARQRGIMPAGRKGAVG